MLVHIEVYSNLHYWQSAQCESLGVLFQVNLPHGGSRADMARQQAAVEPDAYLLVGQVECVEFSLGVVAFDGDVAALIE